MDRSFVCHLGRTIGTLVFWPVPLYDPVVMTLMLATHPTERLISVVKRPTGVVNMAADQGRPSLGSIFVSSTMTALLGVFLTRPSERFYQRELERLTGSRLYQVQRELSRLERAGLVRRARSGNRVYYQVAADHPAFAGLQDAFVKTVGIVEVLQQALAPWSEQIDAAFIYGSVAAGRELADSDVDIFVVTAADPAALVAALGERAESLGREVNVSVYPVAELRLGVAQGRLFLMDVMNGPKLWLVGDDAVLAGLVEDRAADRAET
jgi:predicted nucleotidyltransferase